VEQMLGHLRATRRKLNASGVSCCEFAGPAESIQTKHNAAPAATHIARPIDSAQLPFGGRPNRVDIRKLGVGFRGADREIDGLLVSFGIQRRPSLGQIAEDQQRIART
jgi:hypothetical protein